MTVSELLLSIFQVFELIVDSNFVGNIQKVILSPKFESTIGQNNPENRRSLDSEIVSYATIYLKVYNSYLWQKNTTRARSFP